MVVKDRAIRGAGIFLQITQRTLTARATGSPGFTAATRSPRKNVNFGQLNQTRSMLFADTKARGADVDSMACMLSREEPPPQGFR